MLLHGIGQKQEPHGEFSLCSLICSSQPLSFVMNHKRNQQSDHVRFSFPFPHIPHLSHILVPSISILFHALSRQPCGHRRCACQVLGTSWQPASRAAIGFENPLNLKDFFDILSLITSYYLANSELCWILI